MFGRKNKNQRRNLNDQKSKRLYSYYSNTRIRDEQPDRARQAEQKRQPPPRKWLYHTPSIIAIIVMIACATYILGINSNPKIVEFNSDQNIYLHDANNYQSAAQKIIKKSWLNSNKVTINAADISKQLKQQFPELSDVSVTVPLINRRPLIYISSSKPALMLMGSDNSMVIDSRGVAILPATQVNHLSRYQLISVKDETGLSIKTGQSALPAESVKFISSVNALLKASNIPIDQFILPAKANELDIKLTGQPYYIKMDMLGDSKEQVGAYLAAKDKTASLKDSFKEYIDVRVSGRVYYR